MSARSACALFVAFVSATVSFTAGAHHGWSWTTGENLELTGTIVETNLGNPHGSLIMEVDGTRWTVEVGQPWRNERAGIKDGDLAPGVTLKISGEPSRDADEKRIKVERLWLGETLHELYPNRD